MKILLENFRFKTLPSLRWRMPEVIQSYCHYENRDSRFVAKRSFFSNPNFIVPLPCGWGLRGWVKSSKIPIITIRSNSQRFVIASPCYSKAKQSIFVWIATKIRLRSFFRNDGVITRPLAPSAREGGIKCETLLLTQILTITKNVFLFF